MKISTKTKALNVKDKDTSINTNDISGNGNSVYNYSVYHNSMDNQYFNLVNTNNEINLLLQKALSIIERKDLIISILINGRNKRKARKSKQKNKGDNW